MHGYIVLTIVVHPVPNCFLQWIDQNKVGRLFEIFELRHCFDQKLGQPWQVNINMLKSYNFHDGVRLCYDEIWVPELVQCQHDQVFPHCKLLAPAICRKSCWRQQGNCWLTMKREPLKSMPWFGSPCLNCHWACPETGKFLLGAFSHSSLHHALMTHCLSWPCFPLHVLD